MSDSFTFNSQVWGDWTDSGDHHSGLQQSLSTYSLYPTFSNHSTAWSMPVLDQLTAFSASLWLCTQSLVIKCTHLPMKNAMFLHSEFTSLGFFGDCLHQFWCIIAVYCGNSQINDVFNIFFQGKNGHSLPVSDWNISTSLSINFFQGNNCQLTPKYGSLVYSFHLLDGMHFYFMPNLWATRELTPTQ